MYVHDILVTKGSRVTTIRPDATVGEASRLLAEHRIGAAIVTDAAGSMIGIVSERDIVAGLAAEGADISAKPVAAIMTPNPVACARNDTVADLMAIMTNRRIRHLPVVEDGRLIGLVSIGDVVKFRLDEAKLEVESLRDYVMTAH